MEEAASAPSLALLTPIMAGTAEQLAGVPFEERKPILLFQALVVPFWVTQGYAWGGDEARIAAKVGAMAAGGGVTMAAGGRGGRDQRRGTITSPRSWRGDAPPHAPAERRAVAAPSSRVDGCAPWRTNPTKGGVPRRTPRVVKVRPLSVSRNASERAGRRAPRHAPARTGAGDPQQSRRVEPSQPRHALHLHTLLPS